MGTSVSGRLWTSCSLVLGVACVLSLVDAAPASAFPGTRDDWKSFYGPIPPSTDINDNGANCQLCHQSTGSPWNGYGWNIRQALANPADCDLDRPRDDDVDNVEAFICVELMDSDGDPGSNDNITEINANSQPGWTVGAFNTLWPSSGIPDPCNDPPSDLEPYDPAGTPGPGGICGAGGTGGSGGSGGTGGMGRPDVPPGQFRRGTIVVRPGQSIQKAVDRAQEGTRIYVLAGDYEERGNSDSGLNITKNGIKLIGQSNKQKRVVIKNAGGQQNGIAVVPPMVTECMSCHSSLELPFPLLPGVEPGLPDPEPLVYDIEVKSITIEGFRNGLFTERLDGFLFDDVESIDNVGYGIFPVLSRNGVIRNSYASGSDDSGIWIETSENVIATNNLVEYNVNGFEVSNSDNILLVDNEMRHNTVGAAILLLPDIFDDRPGATDINVVNNWIYDNNKPNTARPGSILSFIPKGIGVLYLGVDDSVISGNLIEDNEFVGVAITDYCAVVSATPFPCDGEDPDPDITLGFLYDQTAKRNRVEENLLFNNGNFDSTDPPEPPDPPFVFFAADLSLLTLPFDLGLPSPPFPEQDPDDLLPYHGNCYEDNQPEDEITFFSLFEFFTMQPQPEDPPMCE